MPQMIDMLMERKDFVPFSFGKDHCECVACGPDGYIYAGGEAGQIYRVNLEDGSSQIVASIGVDALGVCLDADANIYACSENGHAVFRVTQAGEVSVYSKGSPDRPMKIPNYPAFDQRGNLYVSDSSDWDGANGCIYVIRPGGETQVLTESNLRFPNGLALSPDGSELFFIESNMPGVSKARILPDGRLVASEPVVEMPYIVPDGLAFDVERNLYISCYVPHRVYRLTPQSRLEVTFDDWQGNLLNAPTNMAFAGVDMRTMVFGNVGGTWLTKAVMPVPGVAIPCPKL
jgi:sugar lactone lactonase YvrE